MLKHWPYRFKTEEEFIKEFGLRWRSNIDDDDENQWCWTEDDDMDYLFGTVLEQDFPEDERDIKIPSPYDYGLFVTRNMLTKNKPNVPDYTPRKKRNL